jgi:citrate lyase subunit beta/citryl-CoA lyase
MIFTPGHRHDLVAKAIACGTDAVIVDLEDAVALEEKPAARAGLKNLPRANIPMYVRTNAIETGLLWDDVVAAGQANIDGLVIPKAESADVLREIDGALRALEMANGREVGSITVIPLIESGLGVRETFNMMSIGGRFAAVLFGGGEQGDLVADLGVEWTPEGTGLMHARAQVLMDSRAAGCQHPMEAVFIQHRVPLSMRSSRLQMMTLRIIAGSSKSSMLP